MRKKSTLLALLMASMMSMHAQVIQRYLVRDAESIHTPVLCNRINGYGQTYETKDLLGSFVNPNQDLFHTQPAQADSLGFITMPKAEEAHLLYMVTTAIRSNQFTQGTLKITSPVRWEVFVDGASMSKSQNAADSLNIDAAQGIRLRLEPERNYQIAIKLLSLTDDKVAPMLKCEFVPDNNSQNITLYSGYDIKERFTLDHTQYGKRVANVYLSPNGKYLLTRYWNYYDAQHSYVYAELTETKSGKVIIANAQENMRWMPKSNKLYYTVCGEYGNDIVVLDPATRQEEIIAQDVPNQQFKWAPTEEYLILYPYENGQTEQGPLRRIVSPADRIPGSRNRSFLAKYDLKKGITERLTYGKHSTYLNDISSDGQKILFSESYEDATRRPFNFSNLYQMDLTTFAIDTLFTDNGFINEAHYSPENNQLLMIGSPEAFDGCGKNCGEHPIANDFDTQAFIFDIPSRKVECISTTFNPSVEFIQWNRMDNCIYFNTSDGDCKHIYRYSPDKKEFNMLPLKTDVVNAFSLPVANASIAAYVGMDDETAGVAYLYENKKQLSRLIADPMHEILEDVELGKTEEWNFVSKDGTTIHGKYCLPPSFDPQKKYPLIVYYYGGTTPTTKGITNPYCAQLFASRDYVVYVVQPSGTIGYGQEFSARHVNAWGKRTADEIIEGTRKFCEEHPYVDAQHIGCLGASYGGFMTQYLQTQTDLFAAAVSHAGISNVTSYWGEGYWGYSYNGVAAADSYPWTDPELFTQQGSLFNADKINTPLLLLHGTVDTNVPMGESIQLFNALKILGKTVEFIQVDGENHFISDYTKRTLWHNSIMAWFARWLKDSPEWWNDLYPERHL